MPTYGYRCADCGYEFDQYQKFSDDPLTDCPSCAGRVRRVIQPVGVVFKGSGWYINDSRPGASKSADAKADKSEKPESTEKSDSTTASGDGKDKSASKPDDVKKAPEKAATKESKVAAGS